MIRKLLLLTFFTFSLNKTFPCLNGESKVLKNGFFLYEDREGNIPYGHEFSTASEIKHGLNDLDSLYTATKELEYLSDKGLLLILLGQYEKAINLYLEIEKLQPGRYTTASNIGTAYELNGMYELALKWIRKSVEIDSTAHNNSEWIHVKILEAKLKGEKFITSQFLLNTDFGEADKPVSVFGEKELNKLSDALYFQLNERVSFVKPKDKIVAQLLFDLGNIAFLLGNYYDAKADYEMAKKYGFANPLLTKRLIESTKLAKTIEQKESVTIAMIAKTFQYLFIAVVVFALLTIFILIKLRKNNTTRQ